MRIIILTLTLLLMTFWVSAYELGTHARLTNAAYSQSILVTDPAFALDLGIENSGEPFGEEYYDVSGNDVEVLKKDDFEEAHNRMPNGVNPLSISGWLMRGAIREDDHVRRSFPCRVNAPNPQYPGLTDRVKNHFYDPIYDAPLEVLFNFDAGERAPQWGLGVLDPFAVPGQADGARENHYSLNDAFEAYYRALTAHARDGSDAIAPDGVAPASAQQEADVRKGYWATLFRSLGDVVHLIQDMGQPQHTRNDPHAGKWGRGWIAGHTSIYEQYIEARATICDNGGTEIERLA